MEREAGQIIKKRAMMTPIERLIDQHPPKLAKSGEVPKMVAKHLKKGNKISFSCRFKDGSKSTYR
jgi:hypothetical protein